MRINGYQYSIKKFAKDNALLLILLGLVCALSYGFTITHYSIGIDNTNFNFYYHQGGLLAQGRFTTLLINNFISMEGIPFWSNFMGVIILYSAAVLWCMLLKRVGGEKVSTAALIIFAACLVSYPIINESFIYNPWPFSMGYLLSSISLMFLYELKQNFSVVKSILPVVIMIFMVSLNESFAAVYLCGIFMILILEYVTSKGEEQKFWYYFKFFLLSIILLAIAIILEYLISFILIKILGTGASGGANNAIEWGTYSLFFTIKSLFIGLLYRYFLAGYWYFPITILVGAYILSFVIALVLAIKRKKPIILLLMFGLFLATITLSIIKGHVTPYRTCSTFAVFVSFMLMLVWVLMKKKHWTRAVVGVLIVILILNQTRVLNGWFVNDYQRYEHDKEIALDIANTVEKDFDESKPLVFYGDIARSPQVKKVAVNGKPFIGWGVSGGVVPNEHILLFLEFHGHEFALPSIEQVDAGKALAKSMPEYPNKGYILETEGFVLVNLGDSYVWKVSDREAFMSNSLSKFLVKITGQSKEYIDGQISTAIKN